MVHLTRIYTRTGDGGQTRLVDMSLTDKTDPRVAAYGDVDEANSQLGVLLATTDLPGPMVTLLGRVQNELFDLGADLGNPLQTSYAHEPLRITAEYVDRLEADCDAFGDPLPSLRSFVLPGGTPASAHLHVARTIVRRAERTAWAAVERYGTDAPGGLNPLAITYLNRLSDLLFILSRAANATDPSVDGDVLWVPGGSRQQSRRPRTRRGMTDDVQPTTAPREATGAAQPEQARPVTLFSGQWADLPFEEVCRLASEWGYDGLEIACWGDHFDVARAAEDDAYVRAKKDVLESYGLGCWAISTHLDSQAVCDAIIDDRHRNMVKPRVWGDGDPEGVRQRAAEEMKTTARAAAAFGVDTVIGFTGSSIWHYLAMFPPVGDDVIRAGYADFADRWNPIIDVFDARRRPVRPRGASERDRVRLLEHPGGAGGDRPPRRVRAQLRPVAHGVAGTGLRRLPVGVPGPDLPRGLQGHEAADGQRPQRHPVLAPALGRSPSRVGLHLHRARRHEVGGHLPDAQLHRLRRAHLHRVGGRRHGSSPRCSRGPRRSSAG